MYVFSMFTLVIVSVIVTALDDGKYGVINWIILGIFSIDTFYGLFKSPKKWEYVKTHFFDFVALIPFYHGFRMMKFIPLTLQLIRITSIGQKYLLPVVMKLRETGTGRLFVIFIMIFILLPLPLLWFEPNIKTYEDLIWWEMQTVTTVGYGDIVIETGLGRIIGMILMILGVGIISTFTSSLTKVLSNPDKLIHPDKSQEIEDLLETKNFNLSDLETIEDWVANEKKKFTK